MSLKSFTLLDELSLEGSLCKSVQGECCAASLLAGITEPQPRTQRVNLEAPLSLPPAAALHNSSREAELPRLMGVSEHLAVCEKKFPLSKRNPRFEKISFVRIWRKIVYY